MQKKKDRIRATGILIPLGIIFSFVIFVVLIIFASKGETTVTGTYPDPETSDGVSCVIGDYLYPFFSYDGAKTKELKVNLMFEKSSLSTITLISTMTYGKDELAAKSATLAHADMNKSFGSEYGADAFDANYNTNETRFRFSIYTSSEQLARGGQKYFLIESPARTMNEYIKNYEKQGFQCIKYNK